MEPRRLRGWLMRLFGLFTRQQREREFAEELESHLAFHIEDNLRAGMSPEEARRRALIKLGGVTQTQELYREQRGLPMLETLFQDLRFGLRMLRKNPGFTLTAILTLALGIGMNTALFSVMDAVMLKLLPVRQPEQLVLVRWVGGKGMYRGFRGSTQKDEATGLESSTSISYPAFDQFREQNQSLATVFAFAALGPVTVNVEGQAEMAQLQVVTGEYFSGLGLAASAGRVLTTEDEKAGATPTVVISHRYWQRRFGSDPAVIGRTVTMSGAAFTIIGVTPPEFFGTLDVGTMPDLTVTMGTMAQVGANFATYQRSATNWWLHIMGRLKPDASVEQAQAELGTILQRHLRGLPRAAGEEMQPPQIELLAGSQGLNEQRRNFSEQFTILTVIVGLVLLIACVNLANLLLARAATRQKELAVRVALGASRGRLVRQLLTESVMLAGLGGALGLLFAYWAKDALLALLAANYNEFAVALPLDARVLSFTAALSMLTGLLFGLAPALRATRLAPLPMLRESSSGGAAHSRLSKTLLVVQVAMSLVLLIGAGLFVRTLRNLHQIDAGFNQDNLLLFRIRPRYDAAQRATLFQQLTERIAALPGVRAVSASQNPLLAGVYSGNKITVPGYTPGSDEDLKVRSALVGPDFLATMQLPLLLGREFTAQDNQQAPRVVVVNQTLAQKYFPQKNALGQRLIVGDTECQIVGIARDAKYGGIRAEIPPVVYQPYLQTELPTDLSFVVRTAGDPRAAIPAIRQTMQTLDRTVPLADLRTQSEIIARSFTKQRLFATLSSWLGLLALALVCLGLYGVMSYSVAQRTHEVGIRLALGAQASDVLRLVLRQGLKLIAAGTTIGWGIAWGVTRLITHLLYGVSANDLPTFTGITLLLALIGVLACWIPARRATKVDPLVALRHE